MSAGTATATTDVVLRLVGESGEGTVSLGDLLVKMSGSMGLDIYTFQTFPAEIKGGTVMYQIRAKSGTTLSFGDAVDVLVALNEALTILTALEVVPGLLTITTKALVPV